MLEYRLSAFKRVERLRTDVFPQLLCIFDDRLVNLDISSVEMLSRVLSMADFHTLIAKRKAAAVCSDLSGNYGMRGLRFDGTLRCTAWFLQRLVLLFAHLLKLVRVGDLHLRQASLHLEHFLMLLLVRLFEHLGFREL